MLRVLLLFLMVLGVSSADADAQAASRATRARDLGIVVGILPTGPLNAITDVAGVRIGHTTVIEGDSIRTGVTAILPHDGDLFRSRVPAAVHVANGFGKLLGVTQLRELGELETPIVLTCTLCVWAAADAMVEWLLARPGMETVRSINPVVGETNDGTLNDIRARPIRAEHVREALTQASGGAVAEGAVGAGTGTIAFGWKAGIGTSSRTLPDALGGFTVGVLVQSNFGGVLSVNGAPIGRELGQYAFRQALRNVEHDGGFLSAGDGSIMIIVATDAPLGSRNLERLASRAMVGVARTGASMSDGSGDYVIAFSTAASVRRSAGENVHTLQSLANTGMSPLFQAVAEATEEAILNSLLAAESMKGHRATVEALPRDRLLTILRKYNALNWDRTIAR